MVPTNTGLIRVKLLNKKHQNQRKKHPGSLCHTTFYNRATELKNSTSIFDNYQVKSTLKETKFDFATPTVAYNSTKHIHFKIFNFNSFVSI